MKIAVLAGGLSTERDVSLSSGTQVCKALRERGHQAVLLDVFFGYTGELNPDTVFEERESLLQSESTISAQEPDLEKVKAMRQGDPGCFLGPNVIEICKKADIVYMGLHGAEGENGKLQATFDVLGIKYTGSGYLGSALAMDKGMAKKVFLHAGIPTPKGFSVMRGNVIPDIREVGYPCVVKPCCGGSSVGVSLANNEEEYQKALELGFSFEEELLVEECIKGREFSVGVIDGKSLPIIEIIATDGFYDYQTKYQAGMAKEICPAELSRELTEQMQEYAVQVYHELKLEAYARIDFMLDDSGAMYCLEANTLPGMTPTSLLPQEAKEVGIDYGELCEQIIGKSLEKYNANKKKSQPGKYSRGDMIPVWTSPMQGMTLAKIVQVCHADYYGPEEALESEVSMITTDSRQLEKGCLFVAIKGERVDGNRFNEDAYAGGALCCMSENAPQREDRPYLVVDSCLQAVKDMAILYREILGTKLIGITGSVGKTSTKEMIASVLSEHYHTLKTQGNFNNELGVPLTIFRLRKEHEIGIIEMGISDFGEMTRLSQIVKPDACVITNVGPCHLENLGDLDGVLRAKTEIFSHMKPEGCIYLNGDDEKLITVKETTQSITFFGEDTTSSITAREITNLGLRGSSFVADTPKGSFEVIVPVPGRHMVSNALAAIAVALDLGMCSEEIVAGISKFRPVGGHSSITTTENYTILDDCYNANPVSMKAGIDVLDNALGRKVAILGDMFELGEDEVALHGEVGAYAAKSGIHIIICIGTLAKQIAKEAIANQMPKDHVFSYDTKEEAIEALPSIVKKEDTILVKASHGMHFEKIVAVLKDM